MQWKATDKFEHSDADITEVVNAFRMMKAFEAGYKFAVNRCLALTDEQIEKAAVWLDAQEEKLDE